MDARVEIEKHILDGYPTTSMCVIFFHIGLSGIVVSSLQCLNACCMLDGPDMVSDIEMCTR